MFIIRYRLWTRNPPNNFMSCLGIIVILWIIICICIVNKFVYARHKMRICNAGRIFIAHRFTHRNYQIWIILMHTHSEQCNSFVSRFCVENCSFPHLHTNLSAFLFFQSLGKRILRYTYKYISNCNLYCIFFRVTNRLFFPNGRECNTLHIYCARTQSCLRSVSCVFVYFHFFFAVCVFDEYFAGDISSLRAFIFSYVVGGRNSEKRPPGFIRLAHHITTPPLAKTSL